MRARPWNPQRWRSRFFTIWGGQVFSLLGSGLVQFALVWWLTKTTESGSVLTTATIAAVLPGVILGPFIGTLIDRFSRRRVMIIADSAIALSTAVLAVLFTFDVIELWHVYAVILARSVGEAFHFPAMQASTALMVPERHYARVAAINQSLRGLTRIAGPLLGALLLEFLPLHGIIAIDVVTAAIAVIPLLLIAIPNPEPASGPRPSYIRDLAEGFRFVLSWPGLLGVVLIAALLNFVLAPAGSLLPLLIRTHFGGEAIQFAGVQAAMGVGLVVGGLVMTAWGGFKRRMATALLGIVGIGAAAILLGLTPASLFLLALAATLLMGIMQPIANGSLMAALQASTPPDLQGRLFSLVGSAAGAMMPIGLALAGPLSDRFGANVWFLIGGVAAIALGGLAFFIPSILNLEAQGAELAAAREAANGESDTEGVPAPAEL